MQIIQAIAKQIEAEVQWIKGAGAHLKLIIPTRTPTARGA